MRIVEVELINHLVIPEKFHIDLRGKSDVICVDGLNGSGKSFLINNIHPLAQNKRSKDRYPILKRRNGMKRIVYDIGVGEELEVIHEYVPNGNTHSCKSYCNLYINGVKEELNSTGHTKNFADIIRRYLYFDIDTFVCSFLSPKAESIVNAPSSKRKEILKNTMKSSKLLEVVTDRNREKITESNSSIKIYSKQMEDNYRTLPYKSIEEFTSAIDEKKNNYRKLLTNKKITEEEILEVHKSIHEYESLNLDNLPTIKNYIEVLESLEISGMGRAFDELDEKLKNLGILEYKLNVNNKNIKDLQDKIADSVDRSSIRVEIDNMELELRKLKKDISMILGESESHEAISKLNNLEQVVDLISNINVDSDINIESDLKLQVSDLENVISEHRKYILNFEDKMNKLPTTGKLDIGVDKSVNCDNCTLYNTFVRNVEFINSNMKIYTGKLSELESSIGRLNTLKILIDAKERLIRSMDELRGVVNLSIVDNTLSNMSLREIFKGIVFSDKVLDTICDIRSNVNFKIGRIRNIESDLMELYKKFSKSTNDMNSEYEKELCKLTEDNRSIKMSIKNDLAFKEIFDEYGVRRGSEYDRMDLKELTRRYNEMKSVKDLVGSAKSRLGELERSKVTYENSINELKESIVYLIEKQKLLVSINDHLIETKKALTKHQILKDIIEKRIPLKLLESNMDFIEQTVNNIMEENEINLTLDILIEDNDIRMEVATRNQIVDDISLCSSGELCLLGVVLNAVLMHIIGYSIISFDEMDSNLDVIYRESFHNVIYSILEKLDIEQVFCVSHNVSFDMNVGHIVLGDYDKERLHGEIIDY